MTLDVEPRHLEIIKKVFKKIVPDANFFVFGSRAKGCAKPYSDLDVALDLNGKRCGLPMLAKLKFELEETTIPYNIDIVDLNEISDEFKNNIKNDLVKLDF